MNLHSFQLLSPLAQLFWVLRYGIYLTQREEGTKLIRLYSCLDDRRGFFIEVVETGINLEVVRSFTSGGLLKDYAQRL